MPIFSAQHIAILGGGAWGTAVSIHIAKHHRHTQLLMRSRAAADHVQTTRVNSHYLPDCPLPTHLTVSTDLAHLRGACVFIATPVSGLSDALKACQAQGAVAAIWLCKGLDAATARLPHETAQSLDLTFPYGVLSGPSFAKEVAQGLPTALTIASSHAQLNKAVQTALHHEALRVYTSTDIVGVEIGGAVKNVIALACGISDGLALGHNARAALITRGLAETTRFALAMGAKADTLMGLTGVGDLVLTCTGNLSRNRSYGLLLAQGVTPAAIEAQLGHVAEGARCVAALMSRAEQLGVDMPICNAVNQIVAGKLEPKAALHTMLSRQAKEE